MDATGIMYADEDIKTLEKKRIEEVMNNYRDIHHLSMSSITAAHLLVGKGVGLPGGRPYHCCPGGEVPHGTHR